MDINSNKDAPLPHTAKRKMAKGPRKRGTSILLKMPPSTYNLEENGKWNREEMNTNSCKDALLHNQGSHKPKA